MKIKKKEKRKRVMEHYFSDKDMQIMLPVTEIVLKRCECLLCHDSATIYLQFNSRVKSNITIYCQLERGKNGKLCLGRDSVVWHICWFLN